VIGKVNRHNRGAIQSRERRPAKKVRTHGRAPLRSAIFAVSMARNPWAFCAKHPRINESMPGLTDGSLDSVADFHKHVNQPEDTHNLTLGLHEERLMPSHDQLMNPLVERGVLVDEFSFER